MVNGKMKRKIGSLYDRWLSTLHLPAIMRPMDVSDGLARIRPVRSVGWLKRVSSRRRPGHVRAVVVTGNELASVVPPRQRLELLTRDVSLHRWRHWSIPQDNKTARVTDQNFIGLARMNKECLNSTRIDLEVLWRVLHHDVLVNDVLVDWEGTQV